MAASSPYPSSTQDSTAPSSTEAVLTQASSSHCNTTNVKDVDLLLLENSDLHHLAETLRHPSNSTVETVDISCPNNGRSRQVSWNAPDVIHLFKTIGSLPSLRRLQLKFLGGDQDNPFNLEVLTALLSSSPTFLLERLRLILVGPIHYARPQSLEEFCAALSRHRQLKDVRISCCYLSHELLSRNQHNTLGPILQTLGQLPAIETIHMKAVNRGHLGHLPCQALGILCKSTVQHFTIDNIGLDNSHLAVFSQVLAPLTIYPVPPIGCALQDVYLNLSGVMIHDPQLLPSALKTNSSLRRLQLRVSPQPSLDEFLTNTALALRCNPALKELGIHGGGLQLTETVEKTFCDMLDQYNCVLQSLVLPFSATETILWRPKIDMLLAFNQCGRKRLWQHAERISKDEWMQIFAHHSRDLNFLYYYMRIIGPLICK